MRDLRDSKSGVHSYRVAQNSRYLISFYYFHLFFPISLFVLISRNTSIFVASVIGPKTVVQSLSKE